MDSRGLSISDSIRNLEEKAKGLERKFSEMETLRTIWERRRMEKETTEVADRLGRNAADRITAIVGLKESITTEHRLLRSAWIVLFCLGVGATVYYLVQTTREYLSNPTATSVRLASESEHPFPPMLLCPETWFDVEKAEGLGLSINASHYSLSYLRGASFNADQFDIDQARRQFLRVYDSRGFSSLLDYYSAISPDIVQLTNRSEIDTSSSSYYCRGCLRNETAARKTLLDQRLCYTFNLRPVERGFGIYSAHRSLDITFAHSSKYSADWDLYFNHLPHIHVSVHPKLTVRAFFHNTIKFGVQKFVSLSRPERPCERDREPAYSSIECMARCHNAMYRDRIGCGLVWLATDVVEMSPRTTCNYLNRYPPDNLTLDGFFETQANFDIDEEAAAMCVARCPPRCDKMIYDTILQVQETFPKEEEERNGSVVLSVAIKHAAVYQGGMLESIEVYTYSSTMLINNIGGTLGLFIGGTLMTLIQLALFFIESLCRRNRSK